MPDETLQKAGQMLEQTKREGSKPFAGSSFDKSAQATGVIPTITATPAESPFVIPEMPVTNNAEGEVASISERARQVGEQVVSNQELEKSRENSDDTLNLLLDTLNTQGTQGLTARAEEGFGLPEADRELQDINNQILQEEVALNRKIERIQTAPGTTASFKDRAVAEATRVASRKMADLSVIQLAKQGRFDSAKAQADRAVAIEMEAKQTRLDTLSLIYSENKELFNKQEQRQFEAKQAERKRLLDREEYFLKTAYDQKIKQADPLYQLQIQKAEKELQLLGEPTAAEIKAQEAALREAEASIPVMQDKITAVELLKEHSGLDNRVGTSILTRTPQGFLKTVGKAIVTVGTGTIEDIGAGLSGSGQDFAGGIHKLVGGLTLQSLIDAKSRGATFGALSDAELQILANSATAISDWEIKDKYGNGTGFWDIDEASFKREMDTIKELTRRAIVQSGGSLLANDEDALIEQMYQELAPVNPMNYYGI